MTQTENLVQHESERAANKVAAEIRTLLKALGPKDTKRRKVLQAKLRLVTSERKPIDVAAFCGELLATARQIRKDAGTRVEIRRYQRNKRRLTARQPLCISSKVVDTRTDAAGKRLYFELQNAQVISADRVLGTRGALGRLDNNSKRRRVLAPLGNPLLVGVAREELEKNAARKAAK